MCQISPINWTLGLIPQRSQGCLHLRPFSFFGSGNTTKCEKHASPPKSFHLCVDQIRPDQSLPCHPTYFCNGRTLFLLQEFPSDLPRRIFTQGWGIHMRDSQILAFWTARSISLFKALSGNFRPTSLGFSVPGLPGFDHYVQYNCRFFYQQTRRDPFSLLVASSSGSLDVDLLMWLQPQNIVLRAKHIPVVFDRVSRSLIHTKSANNNSVESPLQDHDSRLGTPTVDMFVTVRNTSAHVSDSESTSTGGRCSVS